jgi:hypothetical protein
MYRVVRYLLLVGVLALDYGAYAMAIKLDVDATVKPAYASTSATMVDRVSLLTIALCNEAFEILPCDTG